MKIQKHHITATLSLALSVAIMVVTGMNFLAVRKVPYPEWGPSVKEVRQLSEWNSNLKGTGGDTPVYVLKGEKEGGSMLVLGGTHANEPSGYLSAFAFIENAVVEQGTIYVIPYANHSAMTHNDPGEGNLQYFTLPTKSGERTFRFGSRATNPIDQWPDPDVYVHTSGQRLSGSETRNINRTYPGRENGNTTEKASYAIMQLIREENVNIGFDLHEASPEYPVINATVFHEKTTAIASAGVINLIMEGIDMALEPSPVNLRGLTHREWGDFSDAHAILMETANAAQGRLRGASSEEQILGGLDKFYVINDSLGMLFVPWDENGHPIEERCGRHLEGIFQHTSAYNDLNPDAPVIYSGVPGYQDLFVLSLIHISCV